MSPLPSSTEQSSVIIVSLNVTETNRTLANYSAKSISIVRSIDRDTAPSSVILGPNEDSSINNIIFGIGLVFVVLMLVTLLIKLILRCIKTYKEGDTDKDERGMLVELESITVLCRCFSAKQGPLLPSSSIRRNSSLRNPAAASHRSSLNVETLMEIRNARQPQLFQGSPTPKKPSRT